MGRAPPADAPNRLWVADITYVPTLRLPLLHRARSRRVQPPGQGRAMATHLRTELVVEALVQMAVEQRRPEAVVHHSDRAASTRQLAFGGRSGNPGVALSMGSVGDCFDNAMAESFFATLECELLARTTLATHAEARGHLRVHRGVVQHAAPAFCVELRVAAGVRTAPCGSPCGRRPAGGGSAGAHESGGARIAGDDSRHHRLCCRGLSPVT